MPHLFLQSELGHLSLGGKQGIGHAAEEHVRAGEVGPRLGRAAAEMLLVELDHGIRDRQQRRLLLYGCGFVMHRGKPIRSTSSGRYAGRQGGRTSQRRDSAPSAYSL